MQKLIHYLLPSFYYRKYSDRKGNALFFRKAHGKKAKNTVTKALVKKFWHLHYIDKINLITGKKHRINITWLKKVPFIN